MMPEPSQVRSSPSPRVQRPVGRERAGAASRAAEVSRPGRRDVHISVWPEEPGGGSVQLAAVYREFERALDGAGASPGDVVWERLFLAAPLSAAETREIEALRGDGAWARRSSVRCAVVQPPCTFGRHCELQAIVAPPSPRGVAGRNGRHEIHLADLRGPRSGSFFDEAVGMFEAAEAELARRGSGFRDVVRTWIHLADMDGTYAELNAARRLFFTRRGICPPPASTGIGGESGAAPYLKGEAASGAARGTFGVAGSVTGDSRRPRVLLSLYALSGKDAPRPRPITTPTLNEASDYGADFSRGMAVAEPENGGALLHISGTAAVDESGCSIGPGDFDAQLERTILNIEGLLASQGAQIRDVVSAVGYLRSRDFLASYRRGIERSGLLEVPHAIVEAEVCRPELLCEVEVIAFRRGGTAPD